ncbi:M48 family metallopeptidase [Salinactinospora qingdaonensis]|uniref:Peptidase M48 domain-containing protein n=1 Tax=Salinactinospora qingdaonensis TaxID=702744 RepID=A0ABP7F4V7_9ACTN
MTQIGVSEGEADPARFPYGAPGTPARFPRGHPPGAFYQPTFAPWCDDAAAYGVEAHSALAQSPHGHRHPWEVPLLALSLSALAGLAALAVHGLWLATASPAVTVLVPLGIPVLSWTLRGMTSAGQRARGIKVSPTQFPVTHRMVSELAAQMGLRRTPDAYVLLGAGTAGPTGCGYGPQGCVVIDSGLFEVGDRLRDPDALRFLVAHELGHIAAGHTSFWRHLCRRLALAIPALGTTLARAMEYTADNHAYAHCPEGAHAVRVAAGGKYLYPEVNFGEMADRARTERGMFRFLYNLLSPRPLNVMRMAAIRDRSRPGRLFF